MQAAEELVRGQLSPTVGKSRALGLTRGRSGGTRSRRRARGGSHQLVVMAGESDSARPDSGEGTVL